MSISCQTYSKGLVKYQKRKPAATSSLDILSDEQHGLFYMHHPTNRIAHTQEITQMGLP